LIETAGVLILIESAGLEPDDGPDYGPDDGRDDGPED
jgi:hypothetical protein